MEEESWKTKDVSMDLIFSPEWEREPGYLLPPGLAAAHRAFFCDSRKLSIGEEIRVDELWLKASPPPTAHRSL
jgi:hypothetical protein